MEIDQATGEIIADKDTQAILLALDTLRTFPEALQKLAVAIHDAMAAVATHQKAAKLTLTLTVNPFKSSSNAPLIDEPVVMTADVEVKLPKADPPQNIFYPDDNGNPSRQPQRQRDLGLGVRVG